MKVSDNIDVLSNQSVTLYTASLTSGKGIHDGTFSADAEL